MATRQRCRTLFWLCVLCQIYSSTIRTSTASSKTFFNSMAMPRSRRGTTKYTLVILRCDFFTTCLSHKSIQGWKFSKSCAESLLADHHVFWFLRQFCAVIFTLLVICIHVPLVHQEPSRTGCCGHVPPQEKRESNRARRSKQLFCLIFAGCGHGVGSTLFLCSICNWKCSVKLSTVPTHKERVWNSLENTSGEKTFKKTQLSFIYKHLTIHI